MEIKKLKGRSLSITSKDASIITFAQDLSEKEISEVGANIILGASSKSAFNVVTPGEYETQEVWIMAQSSDVKSDELDIFVLNVEEIRVGIIGKKIKSLTKKQIEKIGLIDILVVDISEEFEAKTDMISEIDPQIVLPISYDEELFSKFIKEVGSNEIIEEKKLKAKMEDFGMEEYQIKVFKLL